MAISSTAVHSHKAKVWQSDTWADWTIAAAFSLIEIIASQSRIFSFHRIISIYFESNHAGYGELVTPLCHFRRSTGSFIRLHRRVWLQICKGHIPDVSTPMAYLNTCTHVSTGGNPASRYFNGIVKSLDYWLKCSIDTKTLKAKLEWVKK